MKIPAPNYTQTPNDLFDHWLPHLGEIELKVLLVVLRKTFGWHKTRDRISISQLEKLTGSTPTNIGKAIKSLIEKGVILKQVIGEAGKQVTYYELVVTEDSNNSYPCRNGSGTPPESAGGTPPESGVTKETIQNKEQQQQAAVVFSSPERESYEFLESLGFDKRSCDSLSRFSIEKIKKHHGALLFAQQKGSIVNPLGWLKSAIEGNWPIPENKEEIAKNDEKIKQKKIDDRLKIKKECENLYDQYQSKFEVRKYFDIGMDVVSCCVGDKHFAMPYEKGCVAALKKFIKEYLI